MLPLISLLTTLDIQIMEYVISYVGDSTNDWFKIKKELINCYPRRLRSRFSRRHYSTKLFFVNDFEKEIMKQWTKITGIELFIDSSKLHPATWKRRPQGWGLRVYNEKRKIQKKLRERKKKRK